MAKWSSIRNRVIDDRGVRHRERRVQVKDRISFRITGRSFWVMDAEAAMPPAERSVVIARRVLRQQPPRPFERLAIWVVGGAFMTLLGAIAIWASLQGSVPWAAIFAAAMVLFVVAVTLSRWQTARDIVKLQCLPPSCLACGYELTGIGEADDGCTVCPECGGAWHLPLFSGASSSGGE